VCTGTYYNNAVLVVRSLSSSIPDAHHSTTRGAGRPAVGKTGIPTRHLAQHYLRISGGGGGGMFCQAFDLAHIPLIYSW
jgi:hypothetical protein